MRSLEDENLIFDAQFSSSALSPTLWIPHYLPQWTKPAHSEARYCVKNSYLQLQIHADQLAWLPSDSNMRVSNIQTALYSGIEGSPHGTHRHRRDLIVQTPQPTRKLYTPSAPARVEARLRASDDSTVMLAFWLVGVEDRGASESGEICIVELFGDQVRRNGERDGAEISLGVKAHHDPQLVEDMDKVTLQGFDATEWHTYAAEWDKNEVRIYVDDRLLKTSQQSIGYELQLMIDLFEFPDGEDRIITRYPKCGDVGFVRGWKL
ncbi:concanavalin A-like lectin/glucanase domain-containing protein [Ilyonectria sp. MPI-CAGE-AT-0026]|nr:concanavalin A-like lectin/glucanase domain-containing protein [Ilyonectria sp. MPI-CAGE-AT-0026]